MPDSWRHVGRLPRTLLAAALIGFTLIATGLLNPARAQTPTVLRVSVLPVGSPVELSRRYAPLGRYLENALDRRIEWTRSADDEASVEALVNGTIDLAMLGGFTFVQAQMRSGGKIIPLVQRDKDANYRSMFITPVDSGIRRLEDLKGRSFSFGPRSSTSGHLMPRATPEEQEILALQEASKFVPTRVENYQRIRAVAESAGLLK